MQIEILALRHQLTVLERQRKRVRLAAADRLLGWSFRAYGRNGAQRW
jgi:hypothetical protein